MPKILINEIDKTTPGIPGNYSNYSVLIAGFQEEFSEEELNSAAGEIERYKEAVAMRVVDPDTALPELSRTASMLLARDEAMDSNGVYEFSDYQDFLDAVGPVAPHYEEGLLSISHYGNQMAYELLRLGYSVVYLPIKPDTCAATLIDANTWEIFKDKANYDFRFIHHGLLGTTSAAFLNNEQAKIDTKLKSVKDSIDSLIGTLDLLHNKEIIIFNKEKLALAENDNADAQTYTIATITDQQLEACYKNLDKYQELFNELTDPDAQLLDDNLLDDSGEVYADLNKAVNSVIDKLQSAFKAETDLENTRVELLAKNIDEATIAAANTNIANLAMYTTNQTQEADELPGRGDCIALIELDENTYINSVVKPEIAIISAIDRVGAITKDNGKFCALTVPSVVYNMADSKVTSNKLSIGNPYKRNKKFPGGFHYLACFMNSLQSSFREWYAAAGYTRGVSSYGIDYTTVTLGEIAINALEPRNKGTTNLKFACNVIANFRGSYYLWGNRTAHPLGDANGSESDLVASHFLNIRQLCTTIKKQLYVACRRFTFDPNSDTLWFNFVNAIRPTLDEMKADQGIRDYRILKVPTTQKATLKAKIRIIPIEAVEDFDLEISLEDSFGETTVSATESI
jgi:hypothetical protein